MRYGLFTVLTLFTVAVSGNFNAIAIGQPPSQYTNTGIEGQVLIGPRCPVVRPGMDCSPRSYQANILVLNQKGKVVIRFRTDKNGRFHVTLPPGRYTLRPESSGSHPFAREQTVIVTGRNFTPVQINYDTGIR